MLVNRNNDATLYTKTTTFHSGSTKAARSINAMQAMQYNSIQYNTVQAPSLSPSLPNRRDSQKIPAQQLGTTNPLTAQVE